jgi:hypothetical protein
VLQGQPIRPDPDFHKDMNRLIAKLTPLVKREAIISSAELSIDLLKHLLGLVQGWYNEIIKTAATLADSRDEKETRRISFVYVYSREYLPQILSIRKSLAHYQKAKDLTESIDLFLRILTYVQEGEESYSLECRNLLVAPAEAIQDGLTVTDPKQVAIMQAGLQQISDEATKLLSGLKPTT